MLYLQSTFLSSARDHARAANFNATASNAMKILECRQVLVLVQKQKELPHIIDCADQPWINCSWHHESFWMHPCVLRFLLAMFLSSPYQDCFSRYHFLQPHWGPFTIIPIPSITIAVCHRHDVCPCDNNKETSDCFMMLVTCMVITIFPKYHVSLFCLLF